MDRIEFVEKVCDVKLLECQKDLIRNYDEICKKYTIDGKVIMGRNGNVYIVSEKEKNIDEEIEAIKREHSNLKWQEIYSDVISKLFSR